MLCDYEMREGINMALCDRCKRRYMCKDALCRSVEGMDIVVCDDFIEEDYE